MKQPFKIVLRIVTVLSLLWGADGLRVFRFLPGSILAAGVAGAAGGAFLYWWPLSRRERTLLIVAGVVFLPVIGLLGNELVYQPVKFGYLNHRVESAQTPSQERAALTLARRWGWWELHLESPPKTWLSFEDLDSVVGDSNRILAVRIEFLETKPNGIPYRAYRTLVEKTNIYLLTRE